MAREKGVVKWFSTEKGYGFIRRESGDEVFVHHTDIDVEGYASLRNGETVEFEIFDSDRGPKARKLVPLERPEGSSEAGAPIESTPQASNEPTARASSRSKGRGTRSRNRGSKGSLRPLADQLREKLGRRFPGFGE